MSMDGGFELLSLERSMSRPGHDMDGIVAVRENLWQNSEAVKLLQTEGSLQVRGQSCTNRDADFGSES